MKRVDRTTLNIDREALARAAALTGVKEKTALVRMGLEALIRIARRIRPEELEKAFDRLLAARVTGRMVVDFSLR